jgi:molybdopterin synthase catalytic subunit
MLEILDTPFDPSAALQQFTARASGSGAIVSFTGLVRAGAESDTVTRLHLQAYSPMTERGIQAAITRAEDQWDLTAITVMHRIGDMGPDEPIVFVAAASPHRRAAFEAVDFMMDYLKTQAIFWKKETRISGDRWIEPRAEDYNDANRWDGATKEKAL